MFKVEGAQSHKPLQPELSADNNTFKSGNHTANNLVIEDPCLYYLDFILIADCPLSYMLVIDFFFFIKKTLYMSWQGSLLNYI